MTQKVRSGKPVILLCWGYHRKGWIEVFEALNDRFEFHYLYWIDKEMEPSRFTACPVHYWSEFTAPRQILQKIKPGKVVFMGTNSLLTVGLVLECSKQKVPTYTFQHGVFHDLKTNLYLDEQIAKNAAPMTANAAQNRRKNITSLKFFLRSLRLKNAHYLLPVAKWQYDSRRMLPLAAFAKNRHPFQKTDYYIVYTKYNGKYFTETEGTLEEQMIEVGVPEFDRFFHRSNENSTESQEKSKPYNLLIDSALTYIDEFNSEGIVSQASYNDFIERLNRLSLEQGRQLAVKLHPYCYANDKFIKHNNIRYYKDTDTVDLILNAETVLGFDSTLILPSIYFKQTILFTLHDFAYLQNKMAEIGAAPALRYGSFSDGDLEASFSFVIPFSAKEELVKRFLYKADGCTVERLAKVLAD